MRMRAAVLALLFVFLAAAVFAQPRVPAPQASPAASVGQTIGVTEVAVDYHRPAVNKRKIWGGLVPYDVPWRAGANEETTISFSTPVKIEGQPLDAGTYGLYIIPTASQWTVIFSKFANGWGTYSYDPSEDALRVNVTPQPAEMQERLSYGFEDLADNSGTLALRWEKLRVPVKIEVDLKSTVMPAMRAALRSGKHWDPVAYTEAARYAVRQGDLDSALEWASRAVEIAPDASNTKLKANILEKRGDAKGAAELRERAKSYPVSEWGELNPGFSLQNEKKYDDAVKWFNIYTAAHPQSWRAYASLGAVYAEKGDWTNAKQAWDKAMSVAPTYSEKVEVQDFINSAAAEGK